MYIFIQKSSMLTTTSKYALQALTFLAHETDETQLVGSELAKSTGIPANYLDKVLQTLRKSGILTATRGLGGGYSFGRPAAKVNLIDVVTLFEDINSQPLCLLRPGEHCTGNNTCPAHPAWLDVHERLLRFLKKTSIAEIAWDSRAR
ncbi:MAG: Rrf2 family transcriptional regulator [bacterium]